MFSRSRQSSSSSTGSSGGDRGGRAIPVLDFDEEARTLWARLNLEHRNRNSSQWNALDSIYRHPTGLGTIYVGNQTAAENYNLLKSYGITRVVNCTFGESKIPNFHNGKLEYYNFPISHWQVYVNSTNSSVIAFTNPVFEFIEAAISKGDSVLVHCLAGAHRAGTTGVACLVHYLKCEPAEAISIAKRCRPIIDPIGQLPEFLNRLYRAELAMSRSDPEGATSARGERDSARSSAGTGSGGQKKGLSVLESAYFRGK